MKYESFQDFFDAFHLCPACQKETEKLILIDEGDGDTFICYSLKLGIFEYKCENLRGQEFAGNENLDMSITKERMDNLIQTNPDYSDHFIEAKCSNNHKYNVNANYRDNAYFYMSSIYDSLHVKYYHTIIDNSGKNYILISTPGKSSIKLSYPLDFFDLSNEQKLAQQIEKMYLL